MFRYYIVVVQRHSNTDSKRGSFGLDSHYFSFSASRSIRLKEGQVERVRDLSVKTFRSSLSAEFSRHCVLRVLAELNTALVSLTEHDKILNISCPREGNKCTTSCIYRCLCSCTTTSLISRIREKSRVQNILTQPTSLCRKKRETPSYLYYLFIIHF